MRKLTASAIGSVFLVTTTATAFLFSISTVVTPMVLNKILSLENETFEKSLAYQIEYFIDVDQHFFLPFLHTFIVTLLLITFCNGYAISYIIGIYYVIGTFNVIKYVYLFINSNYK